MQTQAHTQATLQAQLEAQAQVPAPQADHGGPSIMERFKRMSPPSFKGENDLLLAESWMREIEKIFRAIRCTEDDKERADVWWSSLLRTRFEDGAVEVGWDEFALSAACRQKGEMEQYLEEKKASQKRPATPFQRQERKKVTFQSPQRPVASSSGQVPSQHSPNGKKECPHCRRAHGGTECWKLAGKCLKCGISEHRIKDCPMLQQGVQRGPAPAAAAVVPAIGRPGRPRAPARVFALAREDTEQADHVTEGTVLFLGVHARVLFDTGATHSFISEHFSRKLALESRLESEDLEVPLSVHTPAGTVSTRKCIPSLPVCIEDRALEECFFLLKMKDYDAILGLDWLEEHYALVDCRGKKIVFRIPGEDEFSHPLPRNLARKFVISAMRAMRMMNNGCDAFLASVFCSFKFCADDLLASTSVDVDHKSAATSMDTNSILATSDVDVNVPNLL
ncbi:hypothetical protein Taro_012322 [Colocasia esculenta]|uniref:CCHC-type domain-containing protein n=1 Tax=Colocasia esculenta TaxID=4460 RepID=A0A843UD82_COLES|nr:hypothetical protein [Colocasia esculenta]